MAAIAPHRTESIVDQLEQLHQRIARRAYDLTSGQVFRSLAFPKPVDAAKAKAEYQNGMLKITVPIAPEARATRVDVKAA